MKKEIPWSAGRWSTNPLASREENGQLIVAAEKGSDYWQTTMYEFQRDNGHSLLALWDRKDAIEVSFDLKGFDHLYDQAGLMLWNNTLQWVKAGIEINDGIPHIGAVATETYSDWSLAPVPEWAGQIITIRASRLRDAVIIRARAGALPWRTIRVSRLHTEEGWQAGPYLCAPSSAGLEVVFTRWVRDNPDTDVHEDPQ